MTTDNKTTVTQSDNTTVDNSRRSLIQAGASSAALSVLGFPAIVRAQRQRNRFCQFGDW